MVVIYWEHPSTQELQILVLKRPKKDGGVWQTVTGGVEKGEDFIEGALREAEEESGFQFSHEPQPLGMQYEFEGRWGPAEEVAYSLRVLSTENSAPADQPPTPTIDPKEHCEYRWCDPMEAHRLVYYDKNKEAIFRTAFRPSPIHIDKEGRLFQDGEQITHERTVDLIYRSIERNDDRFDYIEDEFIVHVEGSALPLHAEDTVFHIKSVDAEKGTIVLLSGEELPLEAATVEIGNENVLYCLVKGIRARFLRPAYYQIAEKISEGKSDSDGTAEYILEWNGRHHVIRVASE